MNMVDLNKIISNEFWRNTFDSIFCFSISISFSNLGLRASSSSMRVGWGLNSLNFLLKVFWRPIFLFTMADGTFWTTFHLCIFVVIRIVCKDDLLINIDLSISPVACDWLDCFLFIFVIPVIYELKPCSHRCHDLWWNFEHLISVIPLLYLTDVQEILSQGIY